MPSIENLRKQAKRVMRWHREGHYPVAALIRSHLPDFANMSDGQILAHRFQLTDAQELIAIQRGFTTWQALVEGTNTMSESQSQGDARVAITRAEAQLFVTDLVRSIAFFTDKLGFGTRFTYGEPPFYAQVAREGAHLNLRHVDEPLVDFASVRREGYLSATICVESIKELFLEYHGKGVNFEQNLRTEPWGSRTFIVADPDGNLILFAE